MPSWSSAKIERIITPSMKDVVPMPASMFVVRMLLPMAGYLKKSIFKKEKSQ